MSVSDDEGDDEILVGPNYFAQSRLSEKGFYSDSDFENDQAEIDDIDADEKESAKRPNKDSEEEKEEIKESIDKNGDRQVEPVENTPFGFGYGNNPLFSPSYEGFYNYLPNPYLPPFNFNIPIPILNQYLQRKAYNSGLRYPFSSSQVPLQYPTSYGQNQQQLGAPFSRYFYVQ